MFKGDRCYCPTLRHEFASIDVAFFDTTSFSPSSTVISKGEDDDLSVYIVASPVPTPALVPVPIKPSIT